MTGLARRQLDAAGGTQLGGGQDWFTIDGEPVIVVGDLVAAHGRPPHSPQPTMVEGLDWFAIDGRAVCRAGHRASCGHPTSGTGWTDFP